MRFDLSREVVIHPGGLDTALEPLVRDAGFRVLQAGEVEIAALEQLPKAASSAAVALSSGNWPGISRGPSQEKSNDETASASRQPWVDANGYWIQYLRALYPTRAPVLAYLPDEKAGLNPDRMVPYDSLELALIEAWVFGGSYLLALEARFRQALLATKPEAVAAWGSLTTTILWTALHVQYDWSGLLQVFLIGLLFGWVRWRSGSTTLTFVLHALMNLESAVETVIKVGWPH